MSFEFSQEVKQEADAIIARYPLNEGAMLPILHLVQRECGYISTEAMRYVAQLLEVSPAKVMGVVSFYPMFHTEPVGRHLIYVCSTLSCALVGAERVVDHLKERLGIGVGETTKDGKFTLLKAECLASCGTSPVMIMDDELYENLTPEKIDRILKNLP
ncbi:MAG: NADH-quinone oxidoreductase subunit NuoE [Candidatus Latescibacteria bacterium]|nr:NADH-quinone oxidoreductase subunit NuoE [Candidatus Latescibacterota bacterium]